MVLEVKDEGHRVVCRRKPVYAILFLRSIKCGGVCLCAGLTSYPIIWKTKLTRPKVEITPRRTTRNQPRTRIKQKVSLLCIWDLLVITPATLFLRLFHSHISIIISISL